MLKKTITYVDYNGNTRTEDFYFNLTKAEILNLEFNGEDGSLSDYLVFIIKQNNTGRLLDAFEAIIQKAYGIKNEDGSRFVKSDGALADFISSPAYSEILIDIATDSKKAAEFIEGIVPSDISSQLKAEENANKSVDELIKQAEALKNSEK